MRFATPDLPTFSATTGLPACAHFSNAAMNASGLRIVSMKMPTARVSGSSALKFIKSDTSRFSSLPVDAMKRKPTRGPIVVNASATEPD